MIKFLALLLLCIPFSTYAEEGNAGANDAEPVQESAPTETPAPLSREQKIKAVLDGLVKESNEAIGTGFNAVVDMLREDIQRIRQSRSDSNDTIPLEKGLDVRTEAKSLTGEGSIKAMLGEFDNAIDLHMQAITVDPEFAPAYYNLAAVFAKTNRSKEALASLNKAISLDEKYRAMAKRDKDFDSVRSLPEFIALTERK